MIIINAVVTPLLPRDAPMSVKASSMAFVVRQSLAAVAAVLLLAGTVGIHLSQLHTIGAFGVAAFVLAFVGSGLLLAVEWTQLFTIRDLALHAPQTLDTLEGAGMSLDDFGALLAFAALSLGWISLSVAAARSGRFSRRATTLVIVGFFATPLLHAIAPAVVAGALGSLVLGSGWILLGRELASPVAADEPARAGQTPGGSTL